MSISHHWHYHHLNKGSVEIFGWIFSAHTNVATASDAELLANRQFAPEVTVHRDSKGGATFRRAGKMIAWVHDAPQPTSYENRFREFGPPVPDNGVW